VLPFAGNVLAVVDSTYMFSGERLNSRWCKSGFLDEKDFIIHSDRSQNAPMAMGTRKQRERQEDFWVAHTEIASAPSHPFYRRLNELLEEEKFDEFVEGRCAKFYARKYGRPSLTPGIYFRSLLIGYFEGIDSERGIAWCLADSLGLRQFVAIGLDEKTPDHSTISRSRRLIDLETHREVFGWVLKVLANRGLIKGKRIGIDATTLEENAAMRSIVRRDTEESNDEFLCGLAKASGIETPPREDLVRLDRKRKKRTKGRPIKECKSPADGDARITKMKDGRTHMAHKAQHAVDLDTGAVVAATLQGGDQGDTKTLDETPSEAGMAVAELIEQEAEQRPEQKPKVNVQGVEELIADRGYHSGAVLERMKGYEVRPYIPEKKQKGRRHWQGKGERQKVVYQNRERVRGEYGKSLLRRRGKLVERSFAHCYETGGMRRCRMDASAVNRQYLGQNTLRDHDAEYAAGGAANQVHAPQAVNDLPCRARTVSPIETPPLPSDESCRRLLGRKDFTNAQVIAITCRSSIVDCHSRPRRGRSAGLSLDPIRISD
jgi:transposase